MRRPFSIIHDRFQYGGKIDDFSQVGSKRKEESLRSNEKGRDLELSAVLTSTVEFHAVINFQN